MRGFMQLTLLVALAAVCSARVAGKACDPTVTTASGHHAPAEVCAGELIFEDNFDYFDQYKWQHENSLSGGGNWEFQWYSNNRTNSYTRDGNLILKPSLLSDQFGEAFLTSGTLDINGGSPADRCTNPTDYGCSRTGNSENILNPVKSARLQTVESFNFRYGRIEISAKMPTGDWIWPALWMMPTRNNYGVWPTSGEIDIAEGRGNRNLVQGGKNIGVENIGSTMHFGPYGALNAWDRAHWERNEVPGFNAAFRRYQVEWTPDYIKFSIDGAEIGTLAPPAGGFWEHGNFAANAPGVVNPWRYGSKMAPFDQEFYLILNVAVGGIAFFPDDAQNPDPKPWSNNSPTAPRDFWSQRDRWLATWNLNENDEAAMQVDYVRVWAL